MPVPSDISTQLSKIDEQIVNLLAQRVNISQKAREEDEDAFNATVQAEIVAAWEEAAEEHGLNMAVTSHICRLVIKLCQVAEE